MKKSLVSIIIVNWNGKKVLYDCIKSIKDKCTNNYEIIVVDNNSTDKSIEFIETKFNDIKIIKNNHNEGFAKANNKGFLYSKGEYVLLLNSDTILTDDNINIAREFMDKNYNIDMLGVKLLNSDLSLQKNCYKLPTIKTYFLEYIFRIRCSQNYNYTVEHEVECISGAYMFLRRKAIKEVGLFNEEYYFYQEDTDLCKKFLKKNKKIYFIPNSNVIHIGGSSTKPVKANMLYQMHKNRYIYIDKYFSKKEKILFDLITKIGLISDFLASTIKLILYKMSFMDYLNRTKVYGKIWGLKRVNIYE